MKNSSKNNSKKIQPNVGNQSNSILSNNLDNHASCTFYGDNDSNLNTDTKEAFGITKSPSNPEEDYFKISQ